jgi:spore germination protein GerM
MKKKRILIFLLLTVFLLPACNISVDLFNTPEPTTPVATASLPTAALPTVVPMQTITVYFTNDARFAVGTEPYEDAVTRQVPATDDPIRAVLDNFFLGPNPVEVANGLRLVSSGFTHVRDLKIESGIARVYLGGVCANNGAAYSVANLISKNLSQFPQITAIKIYDENDSNLDPDSNMSSLPYCLEP